VAEEEERVRVMENDWEGERVAGISFREREGGGGDREGGRDDDDVESAVIMKGENAAEGDREGCRSGECECWS
jgi:hypothetical protein